MSIVDQIPALLRVAFVFVLVLIAIRKKMSLGNALSEAAVQWDGNRLILTFEKSFNMNLVQRSMDVVAARVESHMGKRMEISTVHTPASKTPRPRPAAHGSAAPSEPMEEAEEEMETITADQADDAVKNATQHFPGTLKRIKS